MAEPGTLPCGLHFPQGSKAPSFWSLCAQLGKERSGEFHRHLRTNHDSLSNTHRTGQLCAVCAHGEAGSGSKDADTPSLTPYFRLKHVYLKVSFRAPSPGPPDSNGKKENQQLRVLRALHPGGWREGRVRVLLCLPHLIKCPQWEARPWRENSPWGF